MRSLSKFIFSIDDFVNTNKLFGKEREAYRTEQSMKILSLQRFLELQEMWINSDLDVEGLRSHGRARLPNLHRTIQ